MSKSMQEFQEQIRLYDAVYYFPKESKGWQMRHALGHLNKSLAVIATYLDDVDHGREPSRDDMVDKAIPDLLQYALRLSNMFEVDLEQQFAKRQDAIEESKKNAKN
ncbi:hypothetical protein HYX70_02005 [Candidatus Saccharibacteria bacterium]|nr:hypothetical protein [Candidatus Saccharibacteria bacterium]